MNFGQLSSSIFGGSYQLQSTAISSNYQQQLDTQTSLFSSSQTEMFDYYVRILQEIIDFCNEVFRGGRDKMQAHGSIDHINKFTPEFMTIQMQQLNEKAQRLAETYKDVQQPYYVKTLKYISTQMYTVNKNFCHWSKENKDNNETIVNKDKRVSRLFQTQPSKQPEDQKEIYQYYEAIKEQPKNSNIKIKQQQQKIKNDSLGKEKDSLIQNPGTRNRYKTLSTGTFKQIYEQLQKLYIFTQEIKEKKQIQDKLFCYNSAQLSNDTLSGNYQIAYDRYFRIKANQNQRKDYLDFSKRIKNLQKRERSLLNHIKNSIDFKVRRMSKSPKRK